MGTHIENFLSENGIQYHTMVDDVQGLIDEVEQSRTRKSEKRTKDYELDWDDYYEIDVLNQFLDALAEKNDFAEVLNIGKSYEGRDMKVLAITKAGPSAPNVWLEAGIHAREWIAPAVATYIVRELVEDYEEHPEYLDKLNWYFIPSANPDGYAYSHEHYRMWRKTRSATGSIMGCKGVDPNRNWGYHFAESGVSNNKCSDIYPGASDDWYKGVLGTRFAFTTELRDTGRHGFVLPPNQIIPSGEEMWAGFEIVIKRLIEVSESETA